MNTLFKSLIIFVSITLPIIEAVAQTARLTDGRIELTAEQSSGGKILRSKNGTMIGVTLDRSCDKNFKKTRDACIEWTLDTPLPTGWWHGIIESNFKGGYINRDISIMMVGGLNPSVFVAANYIHVKEGEPQRFEFWIYTTTPSKSVRIKPKGDLWRWNKTWPVSRITLEQVNPASLLPTNAITMELPLSADGSVKLPFPLPTGNWYLGGYMTKAGEAVVKGTEGLAIPLSFNLDRWKKRKVYSKPFHIRSPLKSINIKTKGLFSSVILTHKASKEKSVQSIEAVKKESKLTVTVDPSRTVTETLELIGKDLSDKAPCFPKMPKGKKNVVLTSWDDGKASDLRCAEILIKHGYRPAFMLNGNSQALKFMDKLEALGAEIGSHGTSHTALGTMTPAEALKNCISMRQKLEEQLGHPVISFSYPDGYSPSQNEEGDYVLAAVRNSGYWIGRSQLTREQTIDDIDEPLIMRSIGLWGSGNKMLKAAWPRFIEKDAGVFYLKGHSWQIGKTEAQWKKFEDFVAQFANNPTSWYPSNGEFALWLWTRKNISISVKSGNKAETVVELKRPWLHPWLAKRCPISLNLPSGVKSVRWRGQEIPVTDGRVDLSWAE